MQVHAETDPNELTQKEKPQNKVSNAGEEQLELNALV